MNKTMNKLILVAAIVAVVVGSGAFYGGMKYVQGNRQQRFSQTSGSNIGGQIGLRGGQGGAGGGLVSGDIISKDSQSITVKMREGSSKIVFFSDLTEVSKFVAGTSADLVIGKSVTVIGKTNSDGSITATSVQMRPNLPSPTPTK